MVDIHSHILHGLDDGAVSFEVSLEMARVAMAAGTTDIVATPHANSRYDYQPELISERIQELQSAIGDALRIHRGCDFHLSPQNLELAFRDPRRFSIDGLNYLLVEFPDLSLFQGIEQVFDRLKSAGLTPIVTHPERNRHLAADLPRLNRWVRGGVPLQLTAQSVTGEFGPELARWCMKAMEQGLVHFIASDGHDPAHRPPRMDRARSLLDAEFGLDYAELLCETHPRAVIEGQAIDVEPNPGVRRKSKKWFRFGILS